MKKLFSLFVMLAVFSVFGVAAYADELKAAAPVIDKNYSCTDKSISISWSGAYGADGYRIIRYLGKKSSEIGKTNGSTLAYNDKTCDWGVVYGYKVVAFKNADGGSRDIAESKIKYACTKPKAISAKAKNVTDSTVKLVWSRQNCTGYLIYMKQNGVWKRIKTIKNCKTKYYVVKGLSSNKKYVFRVRAYNSDTEGRNNFGTPAIVNVKTAKPVTKLYSVKTTTSYYNTSFKYKGTLYQGSLFSGYETAKYPKYVVLNYKYGTVLVKKSAVKQRKNAAILPTAAIGQYGGRYAGYAACGPTSVTILLNSEKNAKWNKDDLIKYAMDNGLDDQGSLLYGGGMTAPMLLKLIDGYSGGKYSAENIYSSNSANVIKSKLKKGQRALVAVQYTSSIVTSPAAATHFIVICGYEKINGKLYFYYADPYFGNGGRSLLRVSASTLKSSMSNVVREPKTLIVLK